METPYDFLTVGIFAGLVVLFLQRSVDEPPPGDRLWHYLLAGVGCAIANWLGNEGYTLAAIAALLVTLAFIFYVLKPFPNFPPRR